jgi:hypothetical protein
MVLFMPAASGAFIIWLATSVLSADIIPREKKASGVRLRKGMIEETLNRDPFKKRDQEWINLNNRRYLPIKKNSCKRN